MEKKRKINEEKFIIDSTKTKYIEDSIALFIEKEKYGFETRYKSWANCHNYFFKLYKQNANKKFEDLKSKDKTLSLLNLSFYLASWGMYRGSSFILQYDNSIFEKVVEIVLDSKYSSLWNLNQDTIKKNKTNVKNLLINIRDSINNALIDYRAFYSNKSKLLPKFKNKTYISQTLTTKILLGTLCCCPAYDTNFVRGIGGTFNDFNNDNDIDNLLELILKNDIFNKLSNNKLYPLMKIVDMAYFNIGMEKDFKEKYYENYLKKLKAPASEEEWKKVVKSIRQFYYKMNKKANYKIHVGFKCDKKQVDKFIDNYKLKINSIISNLNEGN